MKCEKPGEIAGVYNSHIEMPGFDQTKAYAEQPETFVNSLSRFGLQN